MSRELVMEGEGGSLSKLLIGGILVIVAAAGIGSPAFAAIDASGIKPPPGKAPPLAESDTPEFSSDSFGCEDVSDNLAADEDSAEPSAEDASDDSSARNFASKEVNADSFACEDLSGGLSAADENTESWVADAPDSAADSPTSDFARKEINTDSFACEDVSANLARNEESTEPLAEDASESSEDSSASDFAMEKDSAEPSTEDKSDFYAVTAQPDRDVKSASAPAPTKSPKLEEASVAKSDPKRSQQADAGDSGSSSARPTPRVRRQPVKEDLSTTPVRPPPPPASEMFNSWWNEGEQGEFRVEFVGIAAQESGIVIRFSDALGPADKVEPFVSLTGPDGEKLEGDWTRSKARNVIYRIGLKPGRYEVKIAKDLASSTGKTLGSTVQGPMHVLK